MEISRRYFKFAPLAYFCLLWRWAVASALWEHAGQQKEPETGKTGRERDRERERERDREKRKIEREREREGEEKKRVRGRERKRERERGSWSAFLTFWAAEVHLSQHPLTSTHVAWSAANGRPIVEASRHDEGQTASIYSTDVLVARARGHNVLVASAAGGILFV